MEKVLLESPVFLNLTVAQAYGIKSKKVDGLSLHELKVKLIPYYTRLERFFIRTFQSSIAIKITEENDELLQKFYPTLHQLLSDVKIPGYKNGLEYHFYLLDALRNYNLHALNIMSRGRNLYVEENYRNAMPQEFHGVKFFEGNEFTIAGMLFMVFSILDNKSLDTFINGTFNHWISKEYNACGSQEFMDATNAFKREIRGFFQTNYDVAWINYPVSEGSVFDKVLSLIFKNCAKDVLVTSINENKVSFKIDLIARSATPQTHCWGEISVVDKKIELCIAAGSRFYQYFDQDFQIFFEVDELEEAIEKLRVFPPFYLALFCKNKGVSDWREIPLDKWEPKFNYKRFLNFALFENGTPTIESANNIIASDLFSLFLDIEERAYYWTKTFLDRPYSTLKDALEIIGVRKDVSDFTVNLRNCVAHGVVLNDVFSINDVATRFDLNYIVAALTELMVALKEDAPFGFLGFAKGRVQNLLTKWLCLKYKSAIKRSYCLFIDDEYNRSKIANRASKVDTLLCGGEKEILDFGDSFETLAEMCELEHLDVLFDRQEIKASVPICRKFRFDRITIIELHCEEDIYINGVNTEAKVLNFVSIDGVDWKSHIAKSNGQNFELILQESQNNEFQKIEIYSA